MVVAHHISRELGLDPRSVRRVLTKLETRGLIARVAGVWHPSVEDITSPSTDAAEEDAMSPCGEDTMSPAPEGAEGDATSPEGRTPRPKTGDTTSPLKKEKEKKGAPAPSPFVASLLRSGRPAVVGGVLVQPGTPRAAELLAGLREAG